jgi:hypothetical protein
MFSSIFEAIALPTDGILNKRFNFSLLYISSTFEDKFSILSAVCLYALALKTAVALFLSLFSSFFSFSSASYSLIRYAIWRRTFDMTALLAIVPTF